MLWAILFLAVLNSIAILKIMATQVELAAALTAVKAQIDKVAKEQSDRFGTLTARIKALEDAINAGIVSPEVTAALAEVQTALQALDDTIPDAPSLPPTG